jgi:hypothetical protein
MNDGNPTREVRLTIDREASERDRNAKGKCEEAYCATLWACSSSWNLASCAGMAHREPSQAAWATRLEGGFRGALIDAARPDRPLMKWGGHCVRPERRNLEFPELALGASANEFCE